MAPGGGSGGTGASRNRRNRFGSMPKPPEVIEVPYGLERDELEGKSCGELTEIVLGTKAFEEEIGAICTKLDAARGKRGPNPSYSSLECEIVFVYQWSCGLRSVKEARDRLAGDRAADARRIFGFDRERDPRKGRKRVLRDGIPSEATLSRHRRRFGERRRRGAYQRLARRLIREHLIEFPEMREEARIVGIDGSKLETHYTCPKYNEKGELVNEHEVTCWDGGYVGQHAGADKAGHGFNVLSMATLTALPMTVPHLTPLPESEKVTALPVLDRWERDVAPHLDQDQIHVLLADGGFNSRDVRRRAHEVGFVERIHKVSHGDSKRSKENARAHDRMKIAIEGYPNWHANGHREIFCACGAGSVWKDISKKRGKIVIRMTGDCDTCGRISITPGTWRRERNPTRFVRCQPGEQHKADYAFGNPLTFNDPIAEIYGNKRFGHCEGFHGSALVSRFPVLKGKRWVRRGDQGETELALITAIVHSLAMEQRRLRRAATAALGPPGLAQAA